ESACPDTTAHPRPSFTGHCKESRLILHQDGKPMVADVLPARDQHLSVREQAGRLPGARLIQAARTGPAVRGRIVEYGRNGGPLVGILADEPARDQDLSGSQQRGATV